MDFAVFALLHLFAVLSPGPTLIGLVSFAVNNGFKKTIPFLFGISVGNFIFVAISVFGLSEFIFKIKALEIGFYFFSGLYLMYFGYKTFFKSTIEKGITIKPQKSFLMGFGIEISNPKSIMFTTSLVALILTAESSIFMQSFVIFWLSFVSFVYEALIIFFFVKVQDAILKRIGIFNKIFGTLLVCFGVRLAYLGLVSIFEIYGNL